MHNAGGVQVRHPGRYLAQHGHDARQVWATSVQAAGGAEERAAADDVVQRPPGRVCVFEGVVLVWS